MEHPDIDLIKVSFRCEETKKKKTKPESIRRKREIHIMWVKGGPAATLRARDSRRYVLVSNGNKI